LRLSAAARVFDDDAHTMFAITIIEITQNPDAGMVHLD
jgi:hypothetical protein